jgi:hypothetical protein
VRTVSIDEMTGIQALERAAPSLAMRPGLVERREYEYRRHGTQCLIAAFDVATGKVPGAIGPRRTEGDYVRVLEALLTSAPEDTLGGRRRQPQHPPLRGRGPAAWRSPSNGPIKEGRWPPDQVGSILPLD